MTDRPHRLFTRVSSLAAGMLGLGINVAMLRLVESRSALVLSSVILGVLGSAVCVALAFAPESIWSRLTTAAGAFLQPVTPLPDSRRVGILLIGLGSLVYATQIVVLFPRNADYRGQDEHAFLLTAQQVQERGGTWPLLCDLYGGRFAEANRHPAYIWLLSFRPEFTAGKWLSAGLGVAVFAATIGLSVATRGWLRGGILSVLLGCNYALGKFSVIVGCEILLMGIVGVFWILISGRRDEARSTANGVGGLTLWAAVAGLAMAAAWLTKGTGLLLTAACGVWLVVGPFRRLTTPSFEKAPLTMPLAHKALRAGVTIVVFVSVWCAIASPLLMRNVRRFGSPFFNVNTSLLFVDAYEDPVTLSAARTTREAAAEYWATHTWYDIVQREASGLIWECFILLRSLGPPPLEDARVLPGVGVALLAVIGCLIDTRRERWLLVGWLCCCVPLFAWYIPIAAGERFIIPLLIPILCFAADGLLHTITWFHRRRRTGSA